MSSRDLLRKIDNRSATAAIVGLDYVGLPLAMKFAKAGFRVIGYDVNQRVADQATANTASKHAHHGLLVVLESTTYPGTTPLSGSTDHLRSPQA